MERTSIDPNIRGHADLLAVIGYALVAALAVTYGVAGWMLFGFLVPLVTVLPGFAVTVAAFPRSPSQTESGFEGVTTDLIPDTFERFALSIALSILTFPIAGVALASSPWPITRLTSVYTLAGVAVASSIVGILRRQAVEPAARYRPDPLGTVRGGRASAAVSVTLVLSGLLLVGVLGYTIAAPQPGEGSTELYVLNADVDGESVAAEYPERVEVGEGVPVEVGVENNERKVTEYVLIVRLEDVDEQEVTELERLEERRFTLEPGEQWREEISLTPSVAGENQRVSFLLFTDEPGFFVNQRTAYRHTHLWIDVTD